VFGAADRLRLWNFQFLGESGSFLYILHNSYSDSLCVMMTFFVKTSLTLEFCFATIGPTFPKRKEAAVMTKTTKKAMNTMMTAACAGAAFCCACAASHTVILSVLGAIIMASIIICALVLVLLVLAASAHTPLARITA
jgi:hypothetical protein